MRTTRHFSRNIKSLALTLSDKGAKFIGAHEGVKTRAYYDPIGVVTIGIGHTNPAGPPPVRIGDVITVAEAYRIFRNDIVSVEADIARVLKVPVNQTQWDALVSFVYNLGIGNFSKSTLLRRLNAGDFAVGNEFGKWNKAGGRVLPGLTRRRSEEATLFTTGRYPDTMSATASMLQRGSRGDDVSYIQNLLKQQGFYNGEVDGDFGGGTEDAVEAFQRAKNLRVDGKAGSATLAELERNIPVSHKRFGPVVVDNADEPVVQTPTTTTTTPTRPPVVTTSNRPEDQTNQKPWYVKLLSFLFGWLRSK